MTSTRFYPELWIHAGFYGVVAVLATLPLLSLLALAAIVFKDGSPAIGAIILSVIVAILFGLPFVILARGCWQLFSNKVRYIKKYSSHLGDEVTEAVTTVAYKANYARGVQTLLRPMTFQAGSRSWTQEIRAVSPLAFFPFLDEGEKLKGTLTLRNGEPYLFRFAKRRMWIVPPGDRDLLSSRVGKFLQRQEDKSYGLRSGD